MSAARRSRTTRVVDKLRLIGGEMPAWSDRTPDARPPAGGPVMADLVGRFGRCLPAGGSVLVVGPHNDTLIDALGRYATVTCLVRGQPDAQALAARGVSTLCGMLAKLPDTDRYDAVVALDGMDRVCSVEGPQYDWEESLQALARLLRPHGTLLLAVENELGVHRLVATGAATSAHTDAAWRPLGEFDTKPGSPAGLSARLTAEGLAVSWLAAGWPTPHAPTLVATPDALRDGPAGALSATVAAAVGRAYALQPVLSDPRRLAAAAVRAGLGAEFAPLWLVTAHRTPLPATVFAPPPVLFGDGPVIELVPGPDGQWVRHAVGGGDLTKLDGPLPTGRLLEELLLGACLRHDLSDLRRLLTGWARWLEALDPIDRGSATADNVLLDGDAFGLLDPCRPAAPVDATSAARAALRPFAETLITGGYAHPWPVAVDADSLTAVLAGAAGLELDRTHTAHAEAARAAVPDAVRDHHEQLRALAEQLRDLRAQAQWYADQLAGRDAELRRARMQIAAFSGSIGYRIVRFGVRAARRARKVIR